MRTNPVIVAILLPVALTWVLLRAVARAIARALGWSLHRLGLVLSRVWKLVEPPARRVAGVLAAGRRAVVRLITPPFRLLVRAISYVLRLVGRCIVATWKLVRPAAAATWRSVLVAARLLGPSVKGLVRFTSLAVTVVGVLTVAGALLLLSKPLEIALGIVIALVRPLAAAIAAASGIVMGAFRAALAVLRGLVGLAGPAGTGGSAAKGDGTVADRRFTATLLTHVLLASVLLGLAGWARGQLPDGGEAIAVLAIVAIVHASGAAPVEQYGRALAGFLLAAVAVGVATTPPAAVASDPLGSALSLAVPGFLFFLVGGIVGWVGGDELAKIRVRGEAEEAAKAQAVAATEASSMPEAAVGRDEPKAPHSAPDMTKPRP